MLVVLVVVDVLVLLVVVDVLVVVVVSGPQNPSLSKSFSASSGQESSSAHKLSLSPSLSASKGHKSYTNGHSSLQLH